MVNEKVRIVTIGFDVSFSTNMNEHINGLWIKLMGLYPTVETLTFGSWYIPYTLFPFLGVHDPKKTVV